MIFTGHTSSLHWSREKQKTLDGFAFNPFQMSCKVVAEKPFLLVLATAMVRLGTIAGRTATTGHHRSTPPRMVGT